MARPKIKFSHKYYKLIGIDLNTPAVLLEIFKVRLEDLSSYFKDYDTSYCDDEEKGVQKWELPKGELLVLVFAQGYRIFTTIRSSKAPIGLSGKWVQDKYAYYSKLLGEDFDVIVGHKGVNS